MWLCEDKLKRKTAHFRLPSASQTRACLSSLIQYHQVRYNARTRNMKSLCSQDTEIIVTPEKGPKQVGTPTSVLQCPNNIPGPPACEQAVSRDTLSARSHPARELARILSPRW